MMTNAFPFAAILLVALSGCSQPSSPYPGPEEPPNAATMVPAEDRLEFDLGSYPNYCAQDMCAFPLGQGHYSAHFRFVDGNYTGFHFTISQIDATPGLTMDAWVAARCIVGPIEGPWSPCPDQPGDLAVAKGPFPVDWNVTGLSIKPSEQLQIIVEYSGPGGEAVNGSNGEYHFEGVIRHLKDADAERPTT